MVPPVRAPESRRALLILVGLAVVGVVGAHLVWPVGPAGEWTYLVAVDGAAIAALWGAWRVRSVVAALIAAGVLLSGAADLVYQLIVWDRGAVPNLSLGDVGWLGSYIAVGLALLTLLRRGSGRLDVDGMIDVAAITVVAMVVQWELTVGDLVADTSTPVEARVIWAVYPALDAVLLALVVRAFVSRRLQGWAAWALAAGAACWLFADFGFTIPAAADEYSALLDAGWMLGAVLLAAAVWLPTATRTTPTAPAGSVARYGPIAITILPLLIPGLIEVTGVAKGFRPNAVVLFVATSTLVAIAFLRTARSVRAEATARAELRSRERYARSIAVNASDASAVLDTDGRVLADSPQLAAFFGYPEVDAIGVDAFDLVAEVDMPDVRTMFSRCLASPGQTFQSELRVRHADGSERWLDVRLVSLVDDPDVGGLVVNLHDITDRKRAELDLAHQAFHDSLTGLANRALFADRVEQALRRNARDALDCAVVFLDLDAFKTINDSLGHGPGDELLREVARRLTASVRSGDTVARLGGDEFAVLVEHTRRASEEAQAVAERILLALVAPVEIGGQSVTISASLGISCAGADSTAATLLRDADVAMYRAKASGKGRWVAYDADMGTAAIERLQLDSDLVGALDDDQFRVVYQPVVELASEEVVGFEALLRWHHPTLGLVAPDRFIPVAEENGLIVPIGRWVLTEACRTAARWNERYAGAEPLAMSVNLSARQLAHVDIVADVAAVLEETGLAPSTLVLEMTETSLVQDTQLAAGRLQELRRLGVRIAVDDFGTGYSSLSYLRQFPVDILKIDRSFISSISGGGDVPAILRGLLDLGRTLELSTVAEGVELDAQRDGLRDEQGLLAQGFLFARPLEADDAELLLLEREQSLRGAAPG